jgi:hypothetical protein
MGTQSGNRPLAGTMIAPFNTAGLNVRFTPKSGHSVAHLGCPLCAKSGLTRRSKKPVLRLRHRSVSSCSDQYKPQVPLAVVSERPTQGELI